MPLRIWKLLLGDIIWAQGFRYNAEQQYMKVFRAHPEKAKADEGDCANGKIEIPSCNAGCFWYCVTI